MVMTWKRKRKKIHTDSQAAAVLCCVSLNLVHEVLMQEWVFTEREGNLVLCVYLCEHAHFQMTGLRLLELGATRRGEKHTFIVLSLSLFFLSFFINFVSVCDLVMILRSHSNAEVLIGPSACNCNHISGERFSHWGEGAITWITVQGPALLCGSK